ncbi:unnamed protein product, partial [Iphiclides podalirius]
MSAHCFTRMAGNLTEPIATDVLGRLANLLLPGFGHVKDLFTHGEAKRNPRCVSIPRQYCAWPLSTAAPLMLWWWLLPTLRSRVVRGKATDQVPCWARNLTEDWHKVEVSYKE